MSDPEAKRKIIGREFIEVFSEEARKLDGVKFLAQGTIYPDVIESAASKQGKAHVIKSHHNVGGLPDDLAFELVEPLRDLFKDEVRKLGVALGIPHHMIYRHPFPGPGLGVRILGEVKKNMPISCVLQMIFLCKSLERLAGMIKLPKLLQYLSLSNQWALLVMADAMHG